MQLILNSRLGSQTPSAGLPAQYGGLKPVNNNIRRAISPPTRRLLILPRKDQLIIPVDVITGVSTDNAKVMITTVTDEWDVTVANRTEGLAMQSNIARLCGDLVIVPDDDDGIMMLEGISIVTRANSLQSTIQPRMIQLPGGNIIRANTIAALAYTETRRGSEVTVYLDETTEQDEIRLPFQTKQAGLNVRKYLISLFGDQVLHPDGTRWDRAR